MAVCQAILELAEEMVDPSETVLDDQIEDTINTQLDALAGVGEDDDDVIAFIATGKRLANADPVDFTDDDVDDVIYDDITD